MSHAHEHAPQTMSQTPDGAARPLVLVPQSGAGARRLVASGELDISTYEAFCRALMDEADRDSVEPLVLDLSGVGYTDGRTWTLIAQAGRQMAAQGRPFSVEIAPDSQPERVYLMRGLWRVLARAQRP